MKVIFIAGSYCSGTSALAGVLDNMGIASLPPHFKTDDPLTPNSFESLAFRNLVNSFANESMLTIDKSKAAKFVVDLKNLIQHADRGSNNTVVLKMPLASICISQIIEAVDPYVILVHRPIEEIEASRKRRQWPLLYGAIGARFIYTRLFNDLMSMKKSFLAVSYHDLVQDPRQTMLRITTFCDLLEINNRVDDAIKFVRGKSTTPPLQEFSSRNTRTS